MEVIHTIDPIYDKNSKVLILGTMPSVKSREVGFYYSHPKNKFWKVLSMVYGEKIGDSRQEKIDFLNKHYIALFDVLKSCDISSSSDNSIKNPIPNDLSAILEKSNIKAIFTTGKRAYQLYEKYIYPCTKIHAISLQSTSPANCRKGIEEVLVEEYSQIRTYTDK